jgi:flagellar basal-body rod protein FlgB
LKIIDQQLFDRLDQITAESLHHRQRRQGVLASNISNAQVPGYRAMGYRFEDQLQTSLNQSDAHQVMKTSQPGHYLHQGVEKAGHIKGDLFTRANESVSMDGNTVDVDQEMAEMAENQILYRASIELLTRRWGLLKYAINGGRS